MTTRPSNPFRSTRLRRTATRLGVVATAATFTVGAALAAPAYAAGPAVGAQGQAQSQFDGGSSCPIVSGGDLTSTPPPVIVSTTGTKSVNAAASTTTVAANSGDATDTATMKSLNKVAGSITGASGAFSKAAFTLTQGGAIALSKGLSSGCRPAVTTTGVFLLQLEVKKAGKLTVTVDVPRHMIMQMQTARSSGPMSIGVSYNARGKHTIVRPVKPGTYQVQVLAQSQLGVSGSSISLSRNEALGFRAVYTRS